MTTITAVTKDGQNAIYSDSQLVRGNLKENSSDIVDNFAFVNKIFSAFNSEIGMSGDDATIQAIKEILIKNYDGHVANSPGVIKFNNVMDMRESWRKIYKKLIDEYFLAAIPEEETGIPFIGVRFLIANSNGIFGIDGRGCAHQYKKFYAIGSGEDFAMGAMFAMYDKEYSAHEIAMKGVQAGIEFDLNSGGKVS